MDTTEVIEMPEVTLAVPPEDKWNREKRAFLAMLPELLTKYRDQYVAVHEGRVVGVGEEQIAVGLAAYRQFGNIAILVRKVTDAPPRVVRIPSIRVVR